MLDTFKFPTWESFSAENEKYLKVRKYTGYELKIPMVNDLYLQLDCQNEACLFPYADNIIRFAWCTYNGFAVYSKKYLYSEAGFLKGCADIINAANQFQKFFESFTLSTVCDIRDRIEKYEYDNPITKE